MSEQPQRSAIDLNAVRAIAEAHVATPGALLPILNALQRRFGYVADDAVPVVAEVLNLSRAEVHGVVSFYHIYRRAPGGRHVLYLCRAEACQSMGARELERQVKERLGIDFHQTTTDGRFTLEPVYCLGNCACSPALMIDEAVHGRVTAEQLDALIG